MKKIGESARELPVAHEADICVIGGSCTGVFAAVTAARLGARVALVEKNGIFGGTATAGLVSIWHSTFDTEGNRTIIAGMTREVIDRLLKRGAATVSDPPTPSRHCVLNTHELAIELDCLVSEADVRPFLHAAFCAPLEDDGGLCGIAIEDKSGRRAILAKQFIDATGDGDLVARLGLPVTVNDDLQPPTTCAYFAGLDEFEKANPGVSLRGAIFDRQYPEALPPGTLWHAKMPGVESLRLVAGTRVHNADCSDADELTRAEMDGRRQLRRMMDLLRNHFPHGGEVRLAGLAPAIGVRETRKAVSLHQLTEKEILEGVRFDDAIANGSYRVDIHHSEKGGLTFRYLDGTEIYQPAEGKAESGRWRSEIDSNPTFYQIPYRCLVPKGAANLLCAGRMIDTDRGAHGATRVMVNCNQVGEAAGAAAVQALDTGMPVGEIDTGALRATLARHGACIL